MSDASTTLMAAGYGFVCSTCEKMKRSLASGTHLIGCEALLSRRSCAGPISGQSFPLYEGPLTRPAIAMTCFVCGAKANKVLQAGDDGGYVGCCNTHMDLVSITDEVEYESTKVLVPVQVYE